MLDREFVEIREVSYGQGIAMLCARVLLAGVFLVSAYSRIADWNGSVLFLISHGLGGFAQAACIVSLVFELLGGISLLIGFKTRAGAIALTIFLLGVTLTQNCFWFMPVDSRALIVSMFVKNIADHRRLAHDGSLRRRAFSA